MRAAKLTGKSTNRKSGILSRKHGSREHASARVIEGELNHLQIWSGPVSYVQRGNGCRSPVSTGALPTRNSKEAILFERV